MLKSESLPILRKAELSAKHRFRQKLHSAKFIAEITFRFYAAYTYQGYIKEKKLNLYGSKRIEIPRADFIVIHTFDGSIEQGKDMKLSDSYIDKDEENKVSLELKVKVAGKETSGSGIVYEYIRFCQIYKEKSKNAKTKAEKLEALIYEI